MSKSDDTAPLLGSGEYAAVNAPYPADGLDSKAAGAAGTAEPSAAARMRFTVFNLGNTIMGGGILSLPYAMKLTGLAMGVMLLVVVCLMSIFSLYLLVQAAEYTGAGAHTSFRQLADTAFGKIGRIITDVCMIVACFGVLCSYMVIIEDMLSSLFTAWFGVPACDENVRIYILCGMMVFLVPLASVRYLNHLRYGSAIAVFAVLFVVIAVVISSCEALANGSLDNCDEADSPGTFQGAVRAVVGRMLGFTDVPVTEAPPPTPSPPGCVVPFNLSTDIFQAIPIIGFAYTCQMSFFAAYSELNAPSPRRIKKVIWRALLVCMGIYITNGVFGYLEFRGNTATNILLNYGDDDVLMQVVRIAVATEITLGFPMSAHPCISTVDGVLFGQRPFSWTRKIPETLVVCGLALLVAILVEDVSFIFSLTGATASTAVCFILPAAFVLKLTPEKGFKSFEKIGAVVLLTVGVFIMVISTTVTIINGQATSPCQA